MNWPIGSIPPAPSLPLPSGGSVATVLNPPPALAAQPAGATLDATVVASSTRGEVRVSTALGDMTLKTSTPLPAGTSLTLSVVGQSRDPLLVRLTPPLSSLPGPPGPTGVTPSWATPSMTTLLDPAARSLLSATLPGASASGADHLSSSRSLSSSPALPAARAPASPAGLSATVVRAPLALPLDAPTPLPVGSQLTVRLLDTAAAPPTPSPARPGSGVPPTEPSAPRPASGPPTAAPSSTPGAPASLATLVGQRVGGMVMASGSVAQPLIETPLGVLAVRGAVTAPPGSGVTLLVVGTATPPPPAPMTAASGVPPLSPGAGWPTLSEGLRLLSQSPGGGTSALLDAMPRPGPGLLLAATNYLAAARAGGDPIKWPGEDALRALERTGRRGTDIARRLTQELRDLSPPPKESPAGEWRVHTLPLLNGGEIDPIRVITRTPPRVEDDEASRRPNASAGERFLIEVTLSRLGPFQFDGLYQRGARQLDMVVRTASPLAQDHRHQIGRLYNASLSALGLTGGIRFETRSPLTSPVPLPIPPVSSGDLFA